MNTDGTLRRILNWNKMTERERESTKKTIAKRNKMRLDALEEKMKTEALSNVLSESDPSQH